MFGKKIENLESCARVLNVNSKLIILSRCQEPRKAKIIYPKCKTPLRGVSEACVFVHCSFDVFVTVVVAFSEAL